LLPLLPRLAKVHVEVDESRGDPQPLGRDLLRALQGERLVGDGHHPALLQPDVADPVHLVPGVDHPASADEHRAAHAHLSRMAIRTATPLATCSRMTLAGPSATSGASSTPRFTGPGCITTVPGLRRRARARVRPKAWAYSREEGNIDSRCRSSWTRSIITASASSSAASTEGSTVAPIASSPTGTRVGGPATRTRAPSVTRQ